MNELRAIVMRAGDKRTATGLPRVAMVRAEACSDQVYESMLHLVDSIRLHFVEPFRVEPLAAMAGMNVAAFYRHFRAVTAMTPIQYQKRLRLLKARRQLLFEPHDAASVAFSVGYESASQFGGQARPGQPSRV